LKAYFVSGQEILTGKYLNVEEETPEEETEIDQRIRTILNDYVRPAVAGDGGDIIYQGFDDGIVKLKMQGSCSGCPSSTATLKVGIEGLLTRMVPEVKSVEAV
jgi:Fe-S cluster biogenesis protein NfuA